MTAPTHMDFTFRAFAEDEPGPIWQKHFNKLWPAYRNWFLRYGEADRPTYHESVKALKRHMPEFEPVYEAMVDLAGGGDHAARFLAQYCPPPLFRGCSQAVYHVEEPVLVRSYDYSPYVFDGLLMRSRFAGRQVIAMLDCMSGVLDGINADGLAVSMSFGGREEFGDGFGISLLLRYLLEFAGDIGEAVELLRRVPVQGAYNIMLLDATSKFETIEIAPGSEPRLVGNRVATNHQADSHWPLYEEKVFTHARYQHLCNVIADREHTAWSFTREFLQFPLYQSRFARGFGTLYNAAFYPERGACEYFWPHHQWDFSFENFTEREYQVEFIDPEGYPENCESYSEIYTSKPLPVLRF